MLKPPAPIALAVSGGPDSTALMHLAARLKPVVFTVDHGLRPGSAAEAEAVRAAAAALGLAHEILRWEGCKPARGVQEAARAARYRLLAEACARHGVESLMTGHTLDDQIETVTMRRARGTGMSGEAGMPAQTWLSPAIGMTRLVRPLLGVRKSALVAALEGAGIGFLSDPSNCDPRFDRARLRSGPPPEIDFGRLRSAQGARAMAEAAALHALEREARVLGGVLTVPRDLAARLPDDAADLALGALLRRAGGANYPGTRVERARLKAALAAPGFRGRTLAGTLIRPARRSESEGEDRVVFAPERADGVLAPRWWLPFGQFAQLTEDALALTVA